MARTLTVDQAATALNVSRSTIYRLINDGTLHPVYARSAVRIPRSEIDRFIDDGLAASAAHRANVARLARRRGR